MKLTALFRLFIVGIFLATTYAMNADNKVALIIGNDDYPDSRYGTLRTCVNDADRMEFVLKSLGFTTYVVKDCNQKEMSRAFSDFSKSSKNADVAVFFYSGHAKNIGGESYLIPSKTVFGSEIQRSDLVSVADIRDIMEKNSQLSLIFLDACRDGAYTRVKGATKGERVVPTTSSSNNKPVGTMVFYATQFGDKATMGNGRLSPFTKVLSEHLTDGDEFMTVWKNIKEQVPAEAPGQYPDQEDFYTNGFWFNPIGSRLVAPPTNPVTTPNKYKYITINTNIPNAKINIYGSTFTSGAPIPCEIGKSYVYTINEPGYQPFSGKLQVDTSPDVINVKLVTAEYAEVKVYSNTEAFVYLDSKRVGITYPTSPLILETQSGKRNIELKAEGYYSAQKTEYIDAGKNTLYFTLSKDWGEFLSWNGYEGQQSIRYHFSPKYQIGLSYMYRPEDTRFSFGLYLAASPGWFKGLSVVDVSTFVSVETSTSVTIDDGYGNTTVYKATTNEYAPDKYSSEIDPNNEAKKYNANSLALANVGFNITNGLSVEAGFGVAYHQDRYYMKNVNYVRKTTYTNETTGESYQDPKIELTPQNKSEWFKQDTKWSPALRLGANGLIPLDNWDKCFISIGAGYTFLFSNHKFSSWDANIGLVWKF